MSKISYLVEFTISEGKVEEFKEKAQGYIQAVQENEPGTLTYQWWLSDDGTTALIQEGFDSQEALLTHLGNVGPSLPELLAIAPLASLKVFGTANDQVRGALADLGAQHFPHLAGFDR